MPYSQLIKNSTIKVRHYIDQGGSGFDWRTDFWDVRETILRELNLTTKLEAAKAFNEQIYDPLMQHNPKLQHSGSIDIIEIRIALAAQAVDNYIASKKNFTYSSKTFSWEEHFHKLQRDILSMEVGDYERASYLHEFNRQIGFRLVSFHPKLQYQLTDGDISCTYFYQDASRFQY